MENVPAPRPDPRLPLHPVRVLSVPVAPPIHVKFLGPLRGLLTHYGKKGSVYCPGPEECPKALHAGGAIYKAYSPVEWWVAHEQRWRPAVLEATANLEERLRGRELRGEVWLLSREDERQRNSPVVGAFCERLDPDVISPPFDIEPVLLRFYNVQAVILGIANPLPRQLNLQDVAAPPPKTPADLLPPPPVGEDPEEREKVRRMLDQGRRRFGRPVDAAGDRNGNGHAPPPAPRGTNGATGNGHF